MDIYFFHLQIPCKLSEKSLNFCDPIDFLRPCKKALATSNQVKACEKNCDCTSNSCCCSVSRGVTASVSTQALAVAEQLLVVRNSPVGKCIAHNGQERH